MFLRQNATFIDGARSHSYHERLPDAAGGVIARRTGHAPSRALPVLL